MRVGDKYRQDFVEKSEGNSLLESNRRRWNNNNNNNDKGVKKYDVSAWNRFIWFRVGA
jgi:hypothetical protein